MAELKSPFKFLDSYTKDDRDIFFGRDREIEELYQRVFESKLMLVYGVSGTGKSSLIHCGLANKFNETDWLPLIIRRGGNILESMAAVIKAASVIPQEGLFVTAANFRKAVRSLYLDHYKPAFFIFDQFEELFIFGTRDEKHAFVQVIKTLLESDLQCRFIFVLREEYMANITEFEKHIPSIFSNRVRVEKMSHLNALQTIQKPCNTFNINLEEGFAEALLEKLSPGSTEVELTFLQVFLDKIFRLALEEKETVKNMDTLLFSLSLLNKTGNVSDLLGNFLDDQIAGMDDPDMAMTVLKAFVSGKGTKRPANETETVGNVRSLGKDISHEKVTQLLQNFVKLRVLRDKDDSGRYELRHDALAEKIFEKFSLAEKELLETRQLIENAYQYYLKRRILLNNDDLLYISGKDSLLNLNTELTEFLHESRKNQHARKRTFRRLIAISILAFLLLLSTIGYTIVQKTNRSNAIRFAYESISQFKTPIDRLCLAAYAWEKDKMIMSQEALLKAFDHVLKNQGQDTVFSKIRSLYLTEFTPVSSPIEFAHCSKDDRFIYGFTKDSIIIWNGNGKIKNRFSSGDKPLIDLIMSSNSEYLGGVSTDSMLTIWNVSGNVQFEKKIRFNPVNKSQIFRFTKENNILTLSADHDAVLLDLKGDLIQAFDLHKGNVNALDISDDEVFIATASSDSTVRILHLNSDKRMYEQYETLNMHHDTVWSVDFAPNSRYILTSSADKSVIVTSINNESVYWLNSESDPLAGYPFMAEFDKSGTGIVIQSLESRGKRGKPNMIAMYFELNEANVNSAGINKFDYIEFSPDNNYAAISAGNETFLISELQYILNTSKSFFVNNFRLLELDGQKPFFSHDGKRVYSINDRKIENWFIDIGIISGIAAGYYKIWDKFLY